MKTNGEIIQDLRKSGYNVKVNHYRYIYAGYDWKTKRAEHELRHINEVKRDGLQDLMEARGGKTEVMIFKDNALVDAKTANCSRNDNYDKRLGLKICLGRIKV